MNKEDLKILIENTTDLATLNVFNYLEKFLDSALKMEVKVSENTVRKLTAEEVLVALKDFLQAITTEMKKELDINETNI